MFERNKKVNKKYNNGIQNSKPINLNVKYKFYDKKCILLLPLLLRVLIVLAHCHIVFHLEVVRRNICQPILKIIRNDLRKAGFNLN